MHKSSREKLVPLICRAKCTCCGEVAECSVCLAAEHEGDAVLHTSPHVGPGPISFPPSCLVRCQCCRQHLPLLQKPTSLACSRFIYVLAGPVLSSALTLGQPYMPQNTDPRILTHASASWYQVHEPQGRSLKIHVKRFPLTT